MSRTPHARPKTPDGGFLLELVSLFVRTDAARLVELISVLALECLACFIAVSVCYRVVVVCVRDMCLRGCDRGVEIINQQPAVLGVLVLKTEKLGKHELNCDTRGCVTWQREQLLLIEAICGNMISRMVVLNIAVVFHRPFLNASRNV